MWARAPFSASARRTLTRTSPPSGLKVRALSIRLRNTWPSGVSRPDTLISPPPVVTSRTVTPRGSTSEA